MEQVSLLRDLSQKAPSKIQGFTILRSCMMYLSIPTELDKSKQKFSELTSKPAFFSASRHCVVTLTSGSPFPISMSDCGKEISL